MRTLQSTHHPKAPTDSVEMDRTGAASADTTPLDLAALSAPRSSPLMGDIPLRALGTWTKWEKCASESIEDRYKILPSFLFEKPLLSRETERELIAKAQAGGPEADEARSTLIETNLRFIQYMAVRYSRLSTPAMGVDDLFQEGVFGISRAIDLYDPSRAPASRFTTYAASHIWAAMQRAVHATSDTVYYPHRQRSAAWAILRTAERLTQTLGRDPTYGEISEATTSSHASLAITPEYITYLFAEGILQTHPPADNHYIEHSPHLLPATDLPTPEERSRAQELQRIARIIKECCGDFSDRELGVLKMRYPLDPDQPPLTLEEVGEHFNVTKQRVQQLESDALKLLKKRLKRHGVKSIPN